MAHTATASPSLAATPDPAQVGLKAFRRLVGAWSLTNEEAARLLDVTDRTWGRMKREGWSGRVSQDQLLRLSALIGLYKGLHLYFSAPLADRWVKLANAGPLFRGATPLAFMVEGGLPAILRTRTYLDALRGGM